jgi:FtsP/CotA-like multicopper oxidase with cupredoxin domain
MEPFALKALLLCFILNTCHVISIPIQADDSSVCQQLLPTLSRNTELYDCDALCEGNTANDRTTWCCRDIFTDYESDWPDTGVTREYWFEVDNRVLEPDGHPRAALAVNGSTGIPGPTIYADWGDMIVVHVFNNQSFKENFENSGLAIHWHGINQWETNAHDGVSAVTQCTIRPQSNMTYKWRATQYGTAWYHAHTSLKAWDGVFGGIVINGPSSANYDEDKGVLFLNDWSHHTPEEVFHTVQLFGPQVLANGLLNGTNIWSPTEDSYVCLLEKNHSPDSCFFKRSGISPNRTLGRRFSMEVESGKTYRIRLINAAIDNNFIFTIEGHNITVIAMDLVPICPFTTHSVKIQMGLSPPMISIHGYC